MSEKEKPSKEGAEKPTEKEVPPTPPPPVEEKVSRVTRLVVGKGKTFRPGEAEEWIREYYELETRITDEAEIEIAKSFLDGIITGWLTSPKPSLPPITPSPTVEAGKVQHLTKNNKLLARVVEGPNKLTVLPVESLAVKTQDPAFQKFLVPRVLQKMKDAHGYDFKLEDVDGVLRGIQIYGAFDEKEKKKLLNSVVWSVEKASERA